jgi:hypothetical protein
MRESTECLRTAIRCAMDAANGGWLGSAWQWKGATAPSHTQGAHRLLADRKKPTEFPLEAGTARGLAPAVLPIESSGAREDST